MDNLTHTLTGLAIGRAGLNRLHPKAVWVLMLAANIPDIDIVALAGGQVAYFSQHRAITHALAMMPVMAILPVLLVFALSRSWVGWKGAYLISLVGVASHLLLDWTNAYGIRLGLPFSGRWFHADLNNIVDGWIWAVLILALLGPLLGRLVSSEIGAKPGQGKGLAIFALSFILVYDFGRYLLHERVVAALNSRVYDGAPATLVGAFPGPMNPLRWVAWANTDRLAIRFDVNLAAEFDPGAGSRFYKPEPSPAMEAANRLEAFQVMRDFSLYPLWTVSPADEPEGASRVELRDERFPFAATAVVDKAGRVVGSSFHY
jgi:inner membrane protein